VTIIAFGDLLVNHPKVILKYYSVETMRDKYQCNNRGKNMLANLLQRLAEMFPGSDYQSRMENYIANRNPQSAADVEHWERQYHYEQQRQGVI
tara:strand:- start:288 stop:566 length:279 start_codon:yes stop_codon:yes gene_type:complete